MLALYINGRGTDPGTISYFKSTMFPLKASSHQVFHSFYEKIESSPPPISTMSKSLFLDLAETIAQSLNVSSRYVCGGTNIGD
jgi:hypothetical protein